ncbi:hypothetical protein CC78DRAFT_137569 [Lojkania enalia]|uniref:Rhodopsin domain-containing protein n=1 Tax=Lojkania enalia TaxID=147567 RepID=A0A9P4NCH2_9PLEO|nr:hypothetical protein CC78DRAFT_137569 [Didymosphaeria enalia]
MSILIARSSKGISITDDNLHPLVQVVTWLLLAVTTLMLCFRFLTRIYLKSSREFGIEDILVIFAYLFGLAESATLLLPASEIFGKDIHAISEKELRDGLKVKYAGELIFFLCLTFAKLSFYASFWVLSPDRRHRQVTYLLGGFIIMWAASVIFVVAFQCGGSRPWESTRCINQEIFLYYSEISNALTDFLLICPPVWVIYPLQMSLKTRLLVLSFFSSRLLVIIAIVFQGIYTPRLFTPNWTLSATPYFISTQIVQFLSISTVCVTYFWPFMKSLRSGLMWTDGSTFTTQYVLSNLSSQHGGRIASDQASHKERVLQRSSGSNGDILGHE